MGFSRQEYWSGLPFPSPVDCILSDLSTMARWSWVAPHGMAWFHWVRQDCDPVIRLASSLWLSFQCICPLMPSRNTYHLTWVSLTLDVPYSTFKLSELGAGLIFFSLILHVSARAFFVTSIQSCFYPIIPLEPFGGLPQPLNINKM